MRRRVLLCFVLAVASGCQGGDAVRPTVDPSAPSSRSISDATHASGNPDFFFLPPMVKNPSSDPTWDAGAFNGTLHPTVTICALPGTITDANSITAATACVAGAPVLPPTAAAVDPANELYQLNWQVPNSNTTFYRVTVAVGDIKLGFADLETANNSSQLKNVNTGEFVPLNDGRALPIKFRIERNALCNSTTPAGFCSLPVDLAAGGTVQTTLTGDVQPSGVVIPPGAGTGTVNIAVQSCDTFNDRATDLPVFGPCVRVTSTPALPPSGFAAAATVFICDVNDLTITKGHGGDVLSHDQADRITLHRLDPDPAKPGSVLVTALPHAPACNTSSFSSREGTLSGLLAAIRQGELHHALHEMAGLLSPKPLYAARFIDLGGGGFTAELSDFQFALPSSMHVVPETNEQSADPGQMLPSPTTVRVTDVGGDPVRNARVTFAVSDGGSLALPGTSAACPSGSSCHVALTGEDGYARATWSLGEDVGTYHLLALGRGIAGDDNNGPRLNTVDPFQPIQSHFDATPPSGPPTPVLVLTGSVPFTAYAWSQAQVCSTGNTSFVSGPAWGDLMPATFEVTKNGAYSEPITGSRWIGPFATSGTDNVPVGTYVFRTSFFASKNAVINGSMMADNGAIMLLNGTTVFRMGAWDAATMNPPESAFKDPSSFSLTSGIVNGTNSVDIQLVNTGFSIGNFQPNPTALSFCFTVSHPSTVQTPQ